MVEIKNRQLLIDAKPRIILCGEIHYFRLQRAEWQDRIDTLKAAGCNCLASYVPWLCHETVEGVVDLEGRTRPELDLGAFIDLCAESGLWFFVRPGPFVMAEMKNEGLPYWLYQNHPEILPVGWDGKPSPTRAVDYLAPAFLEETRKWYQSVMKIVAPRLHPRGGNIIAIQLDNEIGMLSWVGNCPDLQQNAIAGFVDWLKDRYEAPVLQRRYPFDLNDEGATTAGMRSPGEDYACRLMQDLGHYLRYRYARYTAKLRDFALEFGGDGVPFVINIHGSSGGRGITFPIGISQLHQAYAETPDCIAGTDLYLGNLTADNFQDLYICNAFTAATQSSDQPLTALEFECGDGNYGGNFGNRYDPSAADFKTRMCIAQGNRLLNYYLFAGGRNYRLDPAPDDGDGRIAITGERHGIAAPVGPEGQLNYTFPRMARIIRTVGAVADKLATMDEEHDGLTLGFIPDYYMTEFRYPGSAAMQAIAGNLEANRSYGAWEIMVRAMLLCGYRFGALDLQNSALVAKNTPVLALASARYMSEDIQRKLVGWLGNGGGLLLYGELPLFDMEGEPCEVLCDALGVRSLGSRQASESYCLSLRADGWAMPRPEVRTHFAQIWATQSAEPLLRVFGSEEVCGFETRVGTGRAIVFTTAYSCDLDLFGRSLERLGATPGLRRDRPEQGLFMTSTVNADGERFLHMLNLDGYDKAFRLSLGGKRLLGGRRFLLKARDGVMLPITVRFDDITVVHSTAELVRIRGRSFEFRLTQLRDVIEFATERACAESDDYTVQAKGKVIRLVSNKDSRMDDRLVVRFR